MPMDIPKNAVADGATDDEFDQRERASPIHEPPPHHSPYIPTSPTHIIHFSNHFACTSSGVAHVSLDDILSEIRVRSVMDAERDNLIYPMHKK